MPAKQRAALLQTIAAELETAKDDLAALMMQLGVDGVFVGSGIFKSGDPGATPEEKVRQMSARAKAIVKATTHYQDAKIIAEVSRNLGTAMSGLDIKQIKPEDLLAVRGW